MCEVFPNEGVRVQLPRARALGPLVLVSLLPVLSPGFLETPCRRERVVGVRVAGEGS